MDEDEHIEIINGEAFMIAAPSRIHQGICSEIGRQPGNYPARETESIPTGRGAGILDCRP